MLLQFDINNLLHDCKTNQAFTFHQKTPSLSKGPKNLQSISKEATVSILSLPVLNFHGDQLDRSSIGLAQS